MKETGKPKKNLSKPIAFKVQILEIRESDFFVKDIPEECRDQIQEDKIELGFGVKFEQSAENKTITVGLRIVYNCLYQGEKCPILTYEFFTTFLLSEYDQIFAKTKSDTEIQEVDNGFLITLLGVVLGTARGMITIRTAGQFINKFYLPIVNPEALFKSLFSKKPEESENAKQ